MLLLNQKLSQPFQLSSSNYVFPAFQLTIKNRVFLNFLTIPAFPTQILYLANRCYHLWDFLNDLLIGRIYPQSTCAAWVDEHEKEFRIIDTKEMAKLWGICKNSKNMTYDKLSRTIRYYCTLDILKKTEGKRLQFKFSKGKMWTKLAQ